jgi:hypothetical protein
MQVAAKVVQSLEYARRAKILAVILDWGSRKLWLLK